MTTTYSFTTLDYNLNGTFAGATYAWGINDLGEVVGFYTDKNPSSSEATHGFTYSAGTYSVPIDATTLGAINGTDAYGINDSGQIVGDFANGIINQGYTETGGTFSLVDSSRAAFDINDGGEIVGEYSGNTQGFLDNNGVFTTIQYDGYATQVQGISNNSAVVGYYQDGTGVHGFEYNNGTYTPIPDVAPGETYVTDINDSGQIVGYYYDSTGLAHGFVETPGGTPVTIPDQGTGGTFIRSINDAGQIAGYYIDSNGNVNGFMATPTIADQPPVIDSAHSTTVGTVSELMNVNVHGSSSLDTTSGVIAFADPDPADRPTATVISQTVVYKNASGQVVTLTPTHLAAIQAAFSIAPESGNTNTGKIDWTYSIQDKALDFLGAGETVTITSTVQLDDHNGGTVTQPVTVTINGADDAPELLNDIAMVRPGSTVSADRDHGLLANDIHYDQSDALSVTSIIFNGQKFPVSAGHPAVVHTTLGTLTVNADGSYTYSANPAVFQYPGAPNAPIQQDVFSYTIGDGREQWAGSANAPAADAQFDVVVTKTASPYSSVVLLQMHYADGAVSAGSGTLIGPNSILTAAHLFEPDPKHGSVTGIDVVTADGTAFTTENISIALDSYAANPSSYCTSNNGPGTPALVEGYNPLLANQSNEQWDSTHDLAVLGVSADIEHTLGLTPLPPATSNNPGLYTALGFPNGQHFQQLNEIAWLFDGEWNMVPPTTPGMSGGPVLSSSDQIVGILSGVTSIGLTIAGVTHAIDAVADHIDTAQLAAIDNWIMNDQPPVGIVPSC